MIIICKILKCNFYILKPIKLIKKLKIWINGYLDLDNLFSKYTKKEVHL